MEIGCRRLEALNPEFAENHALQLRPPSREPPEYLEKRLSNLMRKTRRFM